jgi:hypothetical protein
MKMSVKPILSIKSLTWMIDYNQVDYNTKSQQLNSSTYMRENFKKNIKTLATVIKAYQQRQII